MDRGEDFGAQSTLLQTKTKMRQNLVLACIGHYALKGYLLPPKGKAEVVEP